MNLYYECHVTIPDIDDEQSYYVDLFASLLRDKFDLRGDIEHASK